MARLGAWLKKRLAGSGPSKKKQSADRPPLLASPRPRPLTPTGPSSLASQPPTCLFFAKVPGDLRHTILAMAFGGRTLHMDLVFDYPLLPSPAPPPPAPAPGTKAPWLPHAGISRRSHEAPADGQRKVWRWGGCVCHRNRPDRPPGGRSERYLWTSPWLDMCMTGEMCPCDLYEGTWPDKCQTGIMGFLLSCRQAYTEGIYILFATNNFCLRSQPLLVDLPRLVVPQRLATIASLELVIKVNTSWRKDEREWHYDFGDLTTILSHLTSHCPCLQSLCLSLLIPIRTEQEGGEIVRGAMFPIIDAFYLSTKGSMREMRVELPFYVYRSCGGKSVEEHPLEERLEGSFSGTPWRCFEGETPETQWRSIASYPRPPLRLPLTEEDKVLKAPSSGYWISEGEDPPMSYTVCF